ncbi:hypothetical protein EJ04DRAFT_329644 [Polyplosphaeria fusca]|uniref:Uncharacterized protein n=1 Tax=Polyplosphaeria fusca TaxID=682080 RepID=A0A9P4V7F2_9PLEO|nr:hypothetical protein EJ04DRAFT_329644 [Polyplosphaeria fusca]
MVLLMMTPAIVRAIDTARECAGDELSKLQLPDEPSLAEPEAGKPISHSQLIDISKLLKKHADTAQADHGAFTLDLLLKGSAIHIALPPPKKEPTREYKALMERLRREEEARAYERMLNPPPPNETFSQRFPGAPISAQFHSIGADAPDDDDLSYAEVHRQIILIINIIVSIVACSVFIWVAARHWSVPKRLALSMGGSGLIAIAEVAIYSGYVRRIREAKAKEKNKPEIKEIMESWVIDSSSGKKSIASSSGSKEKPDDGIRYRKGKHR